MPNRQCLAQIFLAPLNGVNHREMPYINRRKPAADRRHRGTKGRRMIGFLFKTIGVLLVLGAIGLTGYAYLGDLSPDQSDVVQPVTLDAE